MHHPPGLTSHKPGLVKVKLFFRTWEPHHLRSHVLKSDFHAKAPYIEDLCVLLPPAQVPPDLLGLDPVFLKLVELSLVPPKSTLRGFELLPGDLSTLAYNLGDV